MARTIAMSVIAALVLGMFASATSACWDNSDELIAKLRKLDLTNDQLADVFRCQKDHKSVIKRAHEERLGCRYHERHDAVFQAQAIGVLTDDQFKKLRGRDRTEIETLQHENYLLRKEIDRLRRELRDREKK